MKNIKIVLPIWKDNILHQSAQELQYVGQTGQCVMAEFQCYILGAKAR